MKPDQHFSFIEFLKLGREQSHATDSFLKKSFFSIFGSLQINPRIRGGRIISEIYYLKIPKNPILLEAGFGAGQTIFALAQNFPNWNFVGYEINKKFVDKAKQIKNGLKATNVTITEKNLEDMDDENSFDIIYSCDVLEHIRDDVKVINNFKTALKPNGILLLHLPLRYESCRRIFPWFKHYDTEDHVRDEYLPHEIKYKLEESGFHVDFIHYGYGLLKGELAFEINNFINKNKLLLVMSQLFSFPLSILLGYFDVKSPPSLGNSLVIRARQKS